MRQGFKLFIMQTQLIKTKDLKGNNWQVYWLPRNPRLIRDDKFNKLKKSLIDDPEMLHLREVIAYDNNGELVVICWNMRLAALKDLWIQEVPTKILPSDTPAEKLRAYTIKDNAGFWEDDMEEIANSWTDYPLEDWGFDIPDISIEDTPDSKEKEKKYDIVISCSNEIEQDEIMEKLQDFNVKCSKV